MSAALDGGHAEVKDDYIPSPSLPDPPLRLPTLPTPRAPPSPSAVISQHFSCARRQSGGWVGAPITLMSPRLTRERLINISSPSLK